LPDWRTSRIADEMLSNFRLRAFSLAAALSTPCSCRRWISYAPYVRIKTRSNFLTTRCRYFPITWDVILRVAKTTNEWLTILLTRRCNLPEHVHNGLPYHARLCSLPPAGHTEWRVERWHCVGDGFRCLIWRTSFNGQQLVLVAPTHAAADVHFDMYHASRGLRDKLPDSFCLPRSNHSARESRLIHLASIGSSWLAIISRRHCFPRCYFTVDNARLFSAARTAARFTALPVPLPPFAHSHSHGTRRLSLCLFFYIIYTSAKAVRCVCVCVCVCVDLCVCLWPR